jgi:isoquinoline 1-oxidoreductase beta subunit
VVQVPSGVVVVADDSWSAQRGREALRVEWEPPAGPGFDSRAFLEHLVEATREPGFEARVEGDIAAGLAASSHRLEAVYEYGFQAHAALEPMNATCAMMPGGGCELWLGTQAANQVQAAVAARLAVPPEKVRLHPRLMGGGFGRRLGVDMAVEAVEVARAAGVPVQVLWNRADDLRYGYYQPGSAHRMTGGLDAQGNVLAWTHTMAGVPHSAFSEPGPGSPEMARDLMWGGYDNPYVYRSMRVAHVTLKPPVPTGPWRAVHYPPGVLARECFLDELAAAGGHDPLALRIALLGDPGDPNRARLVHVLRLAAERAGWGRPVEAGHGLGIAGNIYDGETVLAQVAEVSVSRERGVVVHRLVCALDCGRVVNPLGVEGQVESAIAWGLTAAIKGEITFKDGLAEQTSYFDYPVLAMSEMPAVEVLLLPSDRPPLGIGEQCVSPVAAAVHNAVFAATGRRLRRSPIRPADLG